MSTKSCVRCGKSSGKGNSRSHSNIATNRRFGVNIQTKKVEGKRIDVCTSCIKTLAKTA